MSGGFFSELRRRNVFRAGAAYVVVGWLLIQASDVIAPQLHLPDWAPRLVTFLVILGFPLALLLAWLFELTPQGMQVTQGKLGSKRFYALIAALTIVALGWFGYGTRDEPPQQLAIPDMGPPSIAVLAFENMSPDPENAYFADGISEEILNVLARVDGLRVASRTSAFSFRDGRVSIPEIAHALDVGYVLEGSVRRHGNQVRITAQLIRADTDAHLWSNTYNRDLTDIFRVQEEIAQSIADALAHTLGTRSVEVAATTVNLDAYDRFLRGRARFYERRELDSAIEDLREAVRQDPEFREAWTYLAATLHVAPGYPTAISPAEAARSTQEAVGRAARLIPDHPLVLGIQGFSFMDQGERAAGLEFLRRAADQASQDSTSVMWFGLNLLLAGYIDDAIQVLERAREMDPLVGINRGYLSIAYLSAGREQEARYEAERAVEYGWPAAMWVFATELAMRGESERAAGLMRQLEGETMRFRHSVIDVILEPAKLTDYVDEFRGDWRITEAWLAMRRYDDYFDVLAVAIDDSGRLQMASSWLRAVWLPSAGPVREDPKFFQVAREIGLVRLWEMRGYPPGCSRLVENEEVRLDCPGLRR